MYRVINSYLLTTCRIQFIRRYFGKSDVNSYFLNMPKIAHAKSSSASKKHVTSVQIEVIGSGAPGVPANVVLCTNAGNYLINCGEGTTKLANEYKLKIQRTLITFITHPSWKNISGLPGLALSMQEGSIPEFHIHGAAEIGDIFSAVNRFIKLRHVRVSVQEFSPYEEFSDGSITVKYVFLHSSSASSCSSSLHMDSFEDQDQEDKFFKRDGKKSHLNTKRWPEKNGGNILQKKDANEQYMKKCMNRATSFIFTTRRTPGTLIIEKCIEFGVPPGPLLGLLKNGSDVILDNGTLVKSSEVTYPDQPGVCVIAVECPSENFIDSLLEERAFCEYQSTEKFPEAVIHFSAASVVKTSKYKEWINRFPKSTLHLFINEENQRSGSAGIQRQQYKLNLIQPDIYPLLDNAGIPDFPRTENTVVPDGHTLVSNPDGTESTSGISPIYKDEVYYSCGNNNFINGETLLKIQLKPKVSFDYSRSLVLKTAEFLNEMFEQNDQKEEVEENIKKVNEIKEKIILDKNVYPKIVFLGTGSGRPSKVRNGSGILIFVNESDCILLDCAEYTYGQMINFYGLEKTKEILRNLIAIYVSHMHIDHHWGLIEIIKKRKLAFDDVNEFSTQKTSAEVERCSKNFQKVYVLAPIQMCKWLTLFTEKFEDISHLYEIIPNTVMDYSTMPNNHHLHKCQTLLGLKQIKTVPVVHCPGSFGVSLIHKTEWKITYSGDTRPCRNLINLGMNSDILIHEATFENAYWNDAKLKQHSTIQEAIEVGDKMNAKHILLTHFSQRYCYLPNVESLMSKSNVCIAFDFMQVPYNMLPLLPELIKPLQGALSKYDEMIKTATEHFLLRKEKKRNLRTVDKASTIPNKVSKINF